MSYILDALRRAEAERERGAVPNLNAQPYAAPDGDTDGESRRSAPAWLWIVLGVLLAAVLLLGWRLLASNSPPEPARVITGAPPALAAATPEPAASSTSTTAMPASTAQAPAAVPATNPTPNAAPTRMAAAPSEAPPARNATDKTQPHAERKAATPALSEKAVPAKAAPGPAPGPATTPATASSPPASPASVTAERIYTVAELPDDVRRSLPALPIGGAMYSRKPADRMLIVNGQVFHEGDAITPELKLEQIRLKSAVLRFRSYQYEITY